MPTDRILYTLHDLKILVAAAEHCLPEDVETFENGPFFMEIFPDGEKVEIEDQTFILQIEK